MYKVFTFVVLVFSVFANAQECNPIYTLQYEICANAAHGTQIGTVVSEWKLVNKGAKNPNSEALCREQLVRFQGIFKAQNPAITNVEFNAKEERDRHVRGLDKVDVWCNYKMEMPVAITKASPSCGIASVQSSCFNFVNADFAVECVKQETPNIEAAWKKAGCLIEVRKNVTTMRGMSMAIINQVEESLEVLKYGLSQSGDPAQIKLLNWIRTNNRR